jgi:hypothetical protein
MDGSTMSTSHKTARAAPFFRKFTNSLWTGVLAFTRGRSPTPQCRGNFGRRPRCRRSRPLDFIVRDQGKWRHRCCSTCDQVGQRFARGSGGGLVLPADITTAVHRDLIITLAARHRLPAVYPIHLFVAAGGLMSYGTDQDAMFRLAAFYVDRILRGDKPAELPVQTPTKFETSVNLKTAKALGLTVPPGLLVAADEVVE